MCPMMSDCICIAAGVAVLGMLCLQMLQDFSLSCICCYVLSVYGVAVLGMLCLQMLQDFSLSCRTVMCCLFNRAFVVNLLAVCLAAVSSTIKLVIEAAKFVFNCCAWDCCRVR
jgi:hypothetical protein